MNAFEIKVDFAFFALCVVCIFYFLYACSRDKEKGDFVSKREQELFCWFFYTVSTFLLYGGINWW